MAFPRNRKPREGTMPVGFSTRCPNSDYLGFEASPEAIVAAAKKAEEVGFDAVFVNDHIIVDGSPRAAPWTNVYDPFVAMSFIAAHTPLAGLLGAGQGLLRRQVLFVLQHACQPQAGAAAASPHLDWRYKRRGTATGGAVRGGLAAYTAAGGAARRTPRSIGPGMR